MPIFAAVQSWSAPTERARIIGAVNIISAACMVAGAVIVAVLQAAGMATPWIILILAVASLVVGALIFRFMPASALRDFLYLFFRTVYRLEVKGAENLTKGGVNPIFVCNHVSYRRRPAGDVADRRRAGLRHRLPGGAYRWVRPLLRIDQGDAAQPGQSDRDPRADQCGQGRQSADHLPGRPAHRDRQPDEGL